MNTTHSLQIVRRTAAALAATVLVTGISACGSLPQPRPEDGAQQVQPDQGTFIPQQRRVTDGRPGVGPQRDGREGFLTPQRDGRESAERLPSDQ